MQMTGMVSAIEGLSVGINVVIGSPRPRSAAQAMAGLLAHGSLLASDLPGGFPPQWS